MTDAYFGIELLNLSFYLRNMQTNPHRTAVNDANNYSEIRY